MPPRRFSCSVCGEKCLTKAKHEEHLKVHLNATEIKGKEKPEKKKSMIQAASVKPNGDSFRAQMRGKLTKVHSLLDAGSPEKSPDPNLLSANMLFTLKEAIQGKKGGSDSSSTEADQSTGDIKMLALSLKNSMNSVTVKSAKTLSKNTKTKPSRPNTNVTVSTIMVDTRADSENDKIVVTRNTRRMRSSPESLAEQENNGISKQVATRSGKNCITKKVQDSDKGEKNSEAVQISIGKSRKRILTSASREQMPSTRRTKAMKVADVLSKTGTKATFPKKSTKSPRNVTKKSKQKTNKAVNQTSSDVDKNCFLHKILSNAPSDKSSESGLPNESENSPDADSRQDTQDSETALRNDLDADDPSACDEVSSAKKFSCALCSKIFTRKFHLDRHLKLSPCSGLPPQSFSCHLCNRVYTRKDNLREHLRAHAGELQRKKKHVCQFCGKAYHGQSLLTIHIRKHTGEKPFPCDFCSNRFPSAGALVKHRRTHTGEKPFTCVECGQRFSLKGTLNRHMKVHTGIKPHTCVYCGKQFIQIGGLKAHLFYHTGENGFKCEECGKIFNRKARLQMHKLYVHVKLRPFGCEHCTKSFTRKEDLARHSVLHTGEKPFKCQTCDKSFAIKQSLKLHLLTHTKEEPRSCHECGRAFIRKDCLLRHMRKRHRDLLDKILVDENDEKIVNSLMRNEEDLCENIQELLSLLVDEPTLNGFGWPERPVDEVLEAVIRRCGHMPVSSDEYDYIGRMRENAKLLFTVVIDDSAVKTLLNNQTVDEVILHVLRLAKT